MNIIHIVNAQSELSTPTLARREREFAQREAHFVDVALGLVAEQGFMNMSMAQLARASEYATGTLYKHFDCKEDLLLAMTARGSAARAEMMGRVAAWDAPSRHRMMAIGYSDLLFVTHNPVHFRLEQLATTEDIWMRASACRRQALLAAGGPCAGHVQSIVDDAVAAGDLQLRTHERHNIAMGLWTMSMGTHTLVHAGGLLDYHDIDAPYGLLARNYTLYLNALGWQPLIDPMDQPWREALRQRLHAEVFTELDPPPGAPPVKAKPGASSNRPV